MALAQTSLPVLPGQANATSTVAAAGQPLPGVGGHPVVAAPPPTGPPMTGMGGPGPANHPGGPAVPIPPHVSTINHIPQNGLAENIQQVDRLWFAINTPSHSPLLIKKNNTEKMKI